MVAYFQPDYYAFRNQFRELATQRGFALEAHTLKAKGPGDRDLTIDTAYLGPKITDTSGPARVFAVSCGTHGTEGPSGSAVQAQFLNDMLDELTLPDDGAILLVHAHNPYGFAWVRRQNEDNVDINRNFLEPADPRPTSQNYRDVYDILNPTDLTDETTAEFVEKAWALVDKHGMAWVQQAFTEGQYEFPRGVYYGGKERVESNQRLSGIYGDVLRHAKEAVLIDMHTGAGDYATYEALSRHEVGAPGYRWLCEALGEENVKYPAGEESVMTPTQGNVTAGICKENPHADIRAFSCEIGTFEGARMILAERAEGWLWAHGDRDSEQGKAIVAEVGECSNPADPEWREKVLDIGDEVITACWNKLFS